MASHKHDRLTEDIRRELTDIFRTVKDPRVSGMISIVKVDLAGDQSYCKVYISSLEGLEAGKRAVEGLTSAAGYIRREIAARVKMRRSPQFSFVADDSISESARIAKIIGDLHREEKGDSN